MEICDSIRETILRSTKRLYQACYEKGFFERGREAYPETIGCKTITYHGQNRAQIRFHSWDYRSGASSHPQFSVEMKEPDKSRDTYSKKETSITLRISNSSGSQLNIELPPFPGSLKISTGKSLSWAFEDRELPLKEFITCDFQNGDPLVKTWLSPFSASGLEVSAYYRKPYFDNLGLTPTLMRVTTSIIGREQRDPTVGISTKEMAKDLLPTSEAIVADLLPEEFDLLQFCYETMQKVKRTFALVETVIEATPPLKKDLFTRRQRRPLFPATRQTVKKPQT